MMCFYTVSLIRQRKLCPPGKCVRGYILGNSVLLDRIYHPLIGQIVHVWFLTNFIIKETNDGLHNNTIEFINGGGAMQAH